jgi:hypothetical protein
LNSGAHRLDVLGDALDQHLARQPPTDVDCAALLVRPLAAARRGRFLQEGVPQHVVDYLDDRKLQAVLLVLVEGPVVSGPAQRVRCFGAEHAAWKDQRAALQVVAFAAAEQQVLRILGGDELDLDLGGERAEEIAECGVDGLGAIGDELAELLLALAAISAFAREAEKGKEQGRQCNPTSHRHAPEQHCQLLILRLCRVSN